MSLPAHPYWLSIPTIFMGYITGSNKYTANPIDKSTIYSFLGTSTFLWTWCTFTINWNERISRPKISSIFIGSTIGAVIMSGSIYYMGHLIGVASNKSKQTYPSTFKNLIENPALQ